MHKFLFASILLLGSSLSYAVATKPLGEKALYKLDRNRIRTSAIITKGEIHFTMSEFITTDSEYGVYKSSYEYDFNILMSGRQSGVGSAMLPAEFYDAEFMKKLREDKEITTPDYKVKFIAQEDITLNNRVYSQCDKILLYDIKTDEVKGKPLQKLLKGMLQAMGNKEPVFSGLLDIKDLKLQLYLHPDVPSLGAVKADISGIVRNLDIRVGLDYTTI